ncbi:MAG: YeeE/YedE thiosulfate transporter family protein [Rhodovarius sp.]|nr:YeeE/YedE family protein [Rhodovarius sp.]MCX7931874.1 YeeE/YedE family protein [Rhodovarius sp.]MDW8314481.1 YeeE/YedE thiosulfate transporter family protein [Rhodovarius sp.]
MSASLADSPARAARQGIDLAPYLAGAGIGVLSWIVFVVVATPIGITTSLSAVAGGATALFTGPELVAQNSYWARHPLRLDYGTLFLVGTFLGALASALLSRRFRFEAVPRVWAERFGPSPARRFVSAFLGGVLTMYGARLANGCTSGNGISQGLQLALVGWVFLAVMFVSGVITAWLIFGGRRA